MGGRLLAFQVRVSEFNGTNVYFQNSLCFHGCS